MSWSLDHLTAADRERIAKECFTVQEEHGHELHGLCPAHDDSSASFGYNVEKDNCNCFACGFKGDLIALWGHSNFYNDNREAFTAFTAKYGTETAPTTGEKAPRQRRREGGAGAALEKEQTIIIPEAEWIALPPLPADWCERAYEKWTWNTDIIRTIDLRFWTSPDGKEKRIAIPIRIESGELVNIRLYLPGAADNKIRSWGKGYGKSKLFPAPQYWQKDPVIICEGEKDCITAICHGFNAVTQTAGCNSWDEKFNRFFDGRDVVIAYDADSKGAAGAQKVAAKLLKIAKRVRVITWPDFMGMTEDHGQDLTNWFADHGRTAQQLKDLIATTPAMETPETPRAAALPQDLKRFFGGTRGTQFKPRLVADEIMQWRRLIHEPKSGIIYSWNDRHWEEYDSANIRRYSLELLQVEGTTPRVSDILGIVRDLASAPHGRTMNDRTNSIPLNNGIFDLEGPQIVPHQPENLNTYCLDITLRLDGQLPDCPRWKAFLAESVGDPDTITELQKFFGYCYTRETRHEKALLLIGPGGDGKGTILKVLQSLLGEPNIANVSMGGLEDQFHRVMLVDKLLNVTTEIEAGLLQSDIFKSIVSGEAITAAYKHRNAFSFQPVCKLAFSANKHPNIQDTSDGLYRRLLIIEMEKQFVKTGRADLFLYEKLMEEKAGIFLWGLRGLQLLREQGFTLSSYMQQCLDSFREINNPVASFVKTHCQKESGNWTCTMEVYKKYYQYCSQRGYKAMGESRFGIELRKNCPGISKTREKNGKRRWGYDSLYLIDDYQYPNSS